MEDIALAERPIIIGQRDITRFSESPKGDEELEKGIWLSLNAYLGRHEYYRPESKVTQYVQGRLDFLVDGKKAEVIIVHDAMPEAFSTPGYVVLSDGLLSLLSHQEELDALLGHEWTHLAKKHIESGNAGDQIRDVGRKRLHETEADVRAAELLEDKGINPYGFSSLFKKLEQVPHKPLFKSEKIVIPHDDYEHGSLLDRRLNFEQLARFIDSRHLSHQLSPLQLEVEDFEGYQKDTDLWNRFKELSFLEKRHFLERQFHALSTPESDSRAEEERKQQFQQLVTWQKDLFRDRDSTLSEAGLDSLVFLTVNTSYVKKPIIWSLETMDTVTNLQGEQVELSEWVSGYGDVEAIRSLLSPAKNPILYESGIVLSGYDVETIGTSLLTNYVLQKDNLDLRAYRQLVEQLPYHDKYYYAPIVEYAFDKNIFSTDLAVSFADMLSGSKVAAFDVSEMMSDKIKKRLFERGHQPPSPFSEEEENAFTALMNQTTEGGFRNEVNGHLISARISALERLSGDPIAFFKYVSGFMHDYNLKENQNYMILQDAMFQRMTPADALKVLTKWAEANSYDVEESHFGKTFGEGYSGIKSFKRDDEPSRIINAKDFLDRLLVMAICMEKELFLINTESNLDRLADSRLTSARVETILDGIREAPQRARELGFIVNWDVLPRDLSRFSKLIKGIRSKSLKKAATTRASLVPLIEHLPVFGIEGTLADQQMWQKVSNQLLRSKDVTNINTLLEFLAVSLLANNTQILLQVPPEIAKRIAQSMTFDEAVEFVGQRFPNLSPHIFARALDYLIEDRARTLADFSKLEQLMHDNVRRYFVDEEAIGEAALADTFLIEPGKGFEEDPRQFHGVIEQRHGVEPVRLLEALLKSRTSDEALKKYIFDQWWQCYRFSPNEDIHNFFALEAYPEMKRQGEGRLVWWVKHGPESEDIRYKPFTETVRSVYLADSGMKYAILRKILTGHMGVLSYPEGKRRLQDTFFSDWLRFENDSREEQVTRGLVSSLLEVGTQEELYDHLNGVLMDLILQYPQTKYKDSKIYWAKAKEKAEDFKKTGLLPTYDDHDVEVLAQRLYVLMQGGIKEGPATEVSTEELRLLSLFGEQRQDEVRHTFTPWELALLVGKQFGVGVRMLQFAGQYFPIPEELTQEYSQVYDQVRGQSRLQAYRILMREAAQHPEVAELVDDIEEIRPRVGGGSLMTVYEVQLKNGRREVVAVKNPNVEYNLTKTIDLLRRSIKRAQEINPNERNYALLDTLLGDVDAWMRDEVSDPRFEEKDTLFRAQNDGWNADGTNKYSLFVPQSVPTGTRYLRREEFVEGRNLTALTITDEESNISEGRINREDYQQAIVLLTKSYLRQIAETGLVHADIHPGNFRITADNQRLAVFDRYNMLELDENDREFVQNLVGAAFIGGKEGVRNIFLEYLMQLDENQKIADRRDELNEALKGIGGESLEGEIIDSIVTLKQQGVKIPLKLTLIGKNLQALQTLTKQAGFGSIIEAYLS